MIQIPLNLSTVLSLQAEKRGTRNAEVRDNNVGLEPTTQGLQIPLGKATITNKVRSDVSQSRCKAITATSAEECFGFYDQGFSREQIPTMPNGPSFSCPDYIAPFLTVSDDSLPTTLSIFNTYLEVYKTLEEIRSGARDISISDLKDANEVMRTLYSVSDLGNDVANRYSAGIMSQQGQLHSNILCPIFAFTMVLKGCELAEQISLTVLARPGPDPSKASDFVAANDETISIPERIAGLIRLDFHLSRINRVLTTYIDLTKQKGIQSSTSVAHCQSRLLEHHNQIRSLVDSMSPSWT